MASDDEVTPITETENAGDQPENGNQSKPKVLHLKPDPEDALLLEEARQQNKPDWVEKAFDADFDHPRLSGNLARFIERGYAKLGRRLNQELISEGLSMIAKTLSGLNHAFVKLELVGKSIVDIQYIRNFAHLRYVSLAGNHIQDIKPLNELQFLMSLDLSDNYLTSLRDLRANSYLQILNASKNMLKDLRGVVEHPKLKKLYLSYNKIGDFDLESHKYLRELEVLELRKNRLKTFGTNGLRLPCLKCLFLAQNAIERIGSFSEMKNLEFLDLRRNKLISITGCDFPKLVYLNLSWNFISDPTSLDKLTDVAPELRTLIIKNNAVNGNETVPSKLIATCRRLTRLNMTVINDERRQEAREEYAAIMEEEGQKGQTDDEAK